MLRRALTLAVSAGIIGRATAVSAQAGDHRQAIDALVDKFNAAYNSKYAEAIPALFTEDGILVAPSPILVGRRAIAENYKGRLDRGFGEFRIQFQHYDPDGEWAAGGYTVSLPQGGGERRGNVTSIFRRQGGALLIRVHTFNFLS